MHNNERIFEDLETKQPAVFKLTTGEFSLHFIDDDHWVGYKEHYDNEARMYRVCRKTDCDYCQANPDQMPTPAALTYAILDNKMYVFKMRSNLLKAFKPHRDKYDTLANRDYALVVRNAAAKPYKYEFDVLPEDKRELSSEERTLADQFMAEHPLEMYMG